MTALLLPIPAVVQTSHMAFGCVAYVYHCFRDHWLWFRPPALRLHLLLMLLSYAHILALVLRISSKAFSTCSSHLLVVGPCYSSIAIAYVAYRADLPLAFHVMGNVWFTILVPALSPLTYMQRNKDVKAAITKMACPQDPGHSGP